MSTSLVTRELRPQVRWQAQGHMTHKLGTALRAETQQKKRMFIERQQNAEQHEIHKGDPGLRSLGRGDGQRREERGSQMELWHPCRGSGEGAAAGHRGNMDGDPGQGTGELALCWVSKCEADPENWRKEEALLTHTACLFLGIDRPELVKAIIE